VEEKGMEGGSGGGLRLGAGAQQQLEKKKKREKFVWHMYLAQSAPLWPQNYART
jgi:hypothetical protein